MNNYLHTLIQRSLDFAPNALIAPHSISSFIPEPVIPENENPFQVGNEQEVEPGNGTISTSQGNEVIKPSIHKPIAIKMVESQTSKQKQPEIHEERKNEEISSSPPLRKYISDTSVQPVEDQLTDRQKAVPQQDANLLQIEIKKNRVPAEKKTENHRVVDKDKLSHSSSIKKHTPNSSKKRSEKGPIEHIKIAHQREPHPVQKKQYHKAVKVQPDFSLVEPVIETVIKSTPSQVKHPRALNHQTEISEDHSSIHVHIGTIEVRAEKKHITPHASENRPSFKPEGFDNYKKIRNYRNWGQ